MQGASNSASYYRKREQAERMQANQAGSDKIKQIHLKMAARYQELAEQAEIATMPEPTSARG